MQSISQEINVCEGIIEQINLLNNKWFIIVYNNDHTSFNMVFYVLNKIIPLSEQESYDKTLEIHTKGAAVVYRGDKIHCEKIRDALMEIVVKSKIEQ